MAIISQKFCKGYFNSGRAAEKAIKKLNALNKMLIFKFILIKFFFYFSITFWEVKYDWVNIKMKS